jgi:adenylate cyclase
MSTESRFFIFGDFRFEVPARRLLRIGDDGATTPIPLGLRAAEILLVFLERPGELITKNEIMEAVWRDTVVEESNLTVQISALRRALDVDGASETCIQTVPRRGYRFTLQVIEKTEPEGEALSVLLQPVPASSWAAQLVGGGAGIRWRLGAGFVACFCAAVVVAAWHGFSAGWLPGRTTPPQLSIVVLPFVNSTGGQGLDQLAAALTEDVTTNLAQISGSFVVASSMAQATAGRNMLLPAIGHELGVRYVLEGKIRSSPSAVELEVQLSDAASGGSMWTAQFHGSASEPRVQILQSLLFPLKREFMDAEARRLSTLPDGALTASNLLLKVQASDNHQPITPAKNAENIAALERALMLEPKSADIMIRLAQEYLRPIFTYNNRDENREELLERARRLAEQARALAAGSESMLSLQAYILRVERRWHEAIAAYTALMQAHPKSALYRTHLALSLMSVGQSAEALPLLEEAIELDRGEAARFILYGNVGNALMRLGRDEEAIKWLRTAKEQSSGFSPQLSQWLAVAYAHAGKIEDAKRELREYVKQRPTQTLREMRHSILTAARGVEEERVIDGLALAGLRDHVAENADPGLPITTGLRSTNLNAPTPLGAPGISIVRTAELSALMRGGDDALPLVLSTECSDCLDITIPGAVTVPRAYLRGPLDGDKRQALKTWVDRLLGGNQPRRLVTASWNAERWHARNLAMELATLGYTNVSWYRGGLEAWDLAGLSVKNLNTSMIDRSWQRNP